MDCGKLIELLNEYSKNIGYFNEEDLQGQTKAWILSQEYGFIQWLVENDKIDFYTILKENGTFRKEFYAIENRKEYERLIMLLSVEDEPINFLISILK